MKAITTIGILLSAASAATAPLSAQMNTMSGNSTGMATSNSMAPNTMSKSQMAAMKRCQAMSSDMMMKNKKCAAMAKMHPEMMQGMSGSN